ncbi:MAG: phosphoribosylformylglycinamidine synthase subunit PurL [Coriobacteriales bacterium]|jgi:phosphoribosylformylglycinamidine synthase|nr:phosphoribosylformylglycinamidine synthase subunit PurL [Coriobacteriales bacterium]
MSNIPAPVTDCITLLDSELAGEAAVELGLTPSEYEKIVAIQGRVPSLVELYMYSLMWSEHCSYKHSKKQLRNFSSEGEHVLQGPGENAGVISVGDGWAVAFKMESHNHPSAYDPFAGAATGVGGCVRDIFTMGARPIASLGSLRFGTLDKQRQRELLTGAIAGLASYGDGLGVPTVGGEVYFEEAYEGNCLINAMCLGLMREEDLTRAVGSGPGNYMVLLGAPTGRDGIGGASVLASQEFNEKDEDVSHSVPQGDAILEKKIIEACLNLLGRGLFVALGDLGAAGLTSSASEMASRGGVGVEIDVRKVPVCEDAMQPFEIMVSESQERMLAVVKPGDFAAVEATCKEWGVDCTIVGQITDTGRFVVRDSALAAGEDIVADMPAEMLANSAPQYDPPSSRPAYLDEVQSFDIAAFLAEQGERDLAADTLALIASPNICSRQWIWNQCDAQVMGNTIVAPGSDAAVLRIGDAGSVRGIATSADCNGRFCYLDPYRGAQLALVESMRNLACVGAVPAAITDCLNFGSPEKPEVFYTFEQAVLGLADACKYFGIPVVSGNVSFYNESFGSAIYPTPAVGIVGTMEDVNVATTLAFKQAGDVIVLVGETADELGGSEYLKVMFNLVTGAPPALDLELEGAVQSAVRDAICAGLVSSAHDCSEGGLAASLAESCVAGDLGATVVLDDELPAAASLFSESASRILVSVNPDNVEALLDILVGHEAPYSIIGEVGGAVLSVDTVEEDEQVNTLSISLEALKNQYLNALEKLVQQ